MGLETSNTLMAGMQDVIAETSNLTSITDTLKAMVLPEGTNIGAIKYVFDAVKKFTILQWRLVYRLLYFYQGYRQFQTVCLRQLR